MYTPYLRRWLAVSRTRIFVAVVIPCFIGSSIASRYGYFSWTQFILMLFGLVMIESANLLTADWVTYRGKSLVNGEIQPVIEGSPMISEEILPLRYTIHIAILCLALAALTLFYFALHLGFLIILLGALAVLIGGFYVLSPIRYGFFSTALLPPIIAFGSYYVLTGVSSWEPVIASLPMIFLSSGVIFTYRVLYRDSDSDRFKANRLMLIGLYSASFIMLILIVLGKLVPISMILSLTTLLILFSIIKHLTFNNSDYMPATSLGVLLYTVTGSLIALSYFLI